MNDNKTIQSLIAILLLIVLLILLLQRCMQGALEDTSTASFYPEAVAKLIGEDYIARVCEIKPYVPKPKELLVLPDKAANFNGPLPIWSPPAGLTLKLFPTL